MKKAIKLIGIALILILAVSCVSTSAEFYEGVNMSGKKVYISLDPSTSFVEGVGYSVKVWDSYIFIPSVESVKLNSARNYEKVRTTLLSKGYTLTGNMDEAEIVMVGQDDYQDSGSATVSLAFYEKATGALIVVCNGTYGLGWDSQDDLNHALSKALESVPVLYR